jgi:hypothetical protein
MFKLSALGVTPTGSATKRRCSKGGAARVPQSGQVAPARGQVIQRRLLSSRVAGSSRC